MTLDSVPELARRVLHLEMELKRNKPSHGTDNAALLKRISALESSVAMISKATPAKPQVYTPKPAVTVPKPTDKSLATKMATLEREVERLKVKERPGAWKDWKPTFGYVGGSGTPTISAGGRYMTIGKTVFLLLTGLLTRNGATHSYLTITTPTSIAKFGSGSFTHQFSQDGFTPGLVYKAGGASDFTVSTGTWTNDGYYWFSGFYEMP